MSKNFETNVPTKNHKEHEKPKGKIEYGLLKKKTDLITLSTDWYLVIAMKNLAEDRITENEKFLKSREALIKDLRELHDELTVKLEKLFLAYFPLAAASELQNSDEIKSSGKKVEKVVGNFLDGMPKDSENTLNYLEKEVGDCQRALAFFASAKTVFGKLNWESGFGGKKWAQIADTAQMRLSGKIDAVTFIDTAFNIEHHNGHICVKLHRKSF